MLTWRGKKNRIKHQVHMVKLSPFRSWNISARSLVLIKRAKLIAIIKSTKLHGYHNIIDGLEKPIKHVPPPLNAFHDYETNQLLPVNMHASFCLNTVHFGETRLSFYHSNSNKKKINNSSMNKNSIKDWTDTNFHLCNRFNVFINL